MIEFTKEEISLCKQIAEKHRKEIKYGSWYLTKGKIRNNADSRWTANGYSQTCIPLWTISDCLEFLEGKGYGKILSFIHFQKDKCVFTAENFIRRTPYKKVRGEGETRLAACLKAVVAVLGEAK